MMDTEPSSDATFKTVFWIVMTTAAAFMGAAFIMVR
jgi:hypothetical protein